MKKKKNHKYYRIQRKTTENSKTHCKTIKTRIIMTIKSNRKPRKATKNT